MKPVELYDLLILGGGPAGMTAAIYAARANLKTAIVESNVCGGLANFSHIVENFPSYRSIPGMELMQRIAEQVEALGVSVDQAAELIALRLAGAAKEIETEEFVYRASALILATGRKPVPLEVEVGQCQEIHYCSVCDGSAYKGKRVLVVGGGNSGFDGALYLHSLGVEQIFLVEQMERFSAAQSAQVQLLSCDNVVTATSTSLESLVIENKLSAVRLKNVMTGETRVVPVDGVFVYTGQTPSNEWFKDCVLLDKEGYIVTGEDMETNIVGVFAAGDIRAKKFRQITTAVSDGTIAALAAERFLRKDSNHPSVRL